MRAGSSFYLIIKWSFTTLSDRIHHTLLENVLLRHKFANNALQARSP
jgi:hypothetical protein